jgi:hypothetical protein
MSKAKQKTIPNADLLAAVRDHSDQIRKVYDHAEDERPLLLLDFQRKRIHAHAYEDYRSKLHKDSQAKLDAEYKKAIAKKKVLVLVWDSATRRLVTTTFRYDGAD